jgi:hypothetical protein
MLLLPRPSGRAPLLDLQKPSVRKHHEDPAQSPVWLRGRLPSAKRQGLAIVLYAIGRKAHSDATLTNMIIDQAELNAVAIADVYALRGQSDEAMKWIERAFIQKDAEVLSIEGEFELKSLRADPRFRAFLRKMNLPEQSHRSASCPQLAFADQSGPVATIQDYRASCQAGENV